MVRSKEEMFEEIREGMRGGKGKVTIEHIFKKDELKGNSRLCAKISIDIGASIGTHSHESEEEVYYILSGTGKVTDGGIVRDLVPGDAVLTRDGASHSIENTGDVPLEFMAIINLY